MRGHQLAYRDKTNSYDGWDLPQWEQYICDLAVFGTNAIEMIPPRSDDKPDSVHFPRPILEMMTGVSAIADEYGIDVWLWYPALDEDYTDPATVEFALNEWAEVFAALPRIDAIMVPGGDPGHAPPGVLMALLEKQTRNLHRFHPNAQMWVSPQGYSDAWMEEFLGLLAGGLDWLTGVVYGPWVYGPIARFRERVPARYPIRNYPDITHSLDCQLPVPDWDVVYAITEGREVINPRPLGEAALFRHQQPSTIGFLTLLRRLPRRREQNGVEPSGVGSRAADVTEILREYSRYFIGERYADDFAQGLLALERNWQGPLATNAGVTTTLQQFQALEAAASPFVLKNWRFQQALYRAHYDAYVRSRLLNEEALEEQTNDLLRQAAERGSLLALAEAEAVLDRAVTPADLAPLAHAAVPTGRGALPKPGAHAVERQALSGAGRGARRQPRRLRLPAQQPALAEGALCGAAAASRRGRPAGGRPGDPRLDEPRAGRLLRRSEPAVGAFALGAWPSL